MAKDPKEPKAPAVVAPADAPPAPPATPAVAAPIEDPRIKAAEDRAAQAEREAEATLAELRRMKREQAEQAAKPAAAQPVKTFEQPDTLPEGLPAHVKALHVRQAKGAQLWANTPDVIYVDTDGREFPAKIVPIPTNKYPVVMLPAVRDPAAELRKISEMQPEQQMEAFRLYQERMANGVKNLRIGKRYMPIVDYRGIDVLAMEVNGKLIPAPELLVNISDTTEVEQLVLKHHIRPEEYASKSPRGTHQVPYFKIPS